MRFTTDDIKRFVREAQQDYRAALARRNEARVAVRIWDGGHMAQQYPEAVAEYLPKAQAEELELIEVLRKRREELKRWKRELAAAL